MLVDHQVAKVYVGLVLQYTLHDLLCFMDEYYHRFVGFSMI